jgi:hypothetical protein
VLVKISGRPAGSDQVVEAQVLTEADAGLTEGEALTRIGGAADLAGKPGSPGLYRCAPRHRCGADACSMTVPILRKLIKD